jgi:hypothetical protein
MCGQRFRRTVVAVKAGAVHGSTGPSGSHVIPILLKSVLTEQIRLLGYPRSPEL